MNIKGIGVGRTPYDQFRIQQDREREELASGVKDSTPKSRDAVSVSDGARLLSTARETAADSTGIREDKVARLKAMVQNGTYAPNGRAIAEKIVSEELDLWR
ncbi:negative regulator of flagellin synthesis FlgM [Desulfobaculum xiamenense]|uniref:Negative regulator of flagellin synthesis n=1 Tax=Desulfobaculum xiamenense TaxID=995050 RepID=A0A846QRK6_9BACT|nr:negative regulator of flagellin synthesis FlgM [Desulfobaculum xiamenense]